MQQAGWYPDPSGEPNQERYWDGQSWSTVTRPVGGMPQAGSPSGAVPQGPQPGWNPTGTYNPQNPPPPVGGQQTSTTTAFAVPPKKRRVGLVIAITALVLATAALAVFLWRPWDPRTPIETESPAPTAPTTSTSATANPSPDGSTTKPTPGGSTSPSDTPTGPVELSCAAGVGTQGEPATQYYAYGLGYETPENWGFRYDKKQWTWLNEQAVWGRKEGNDFSGIALGGVRQDQGFTKEKAVEQYVKCLTSYGAFNGGDLKQQPVEPTTLGGMNAQKVSMVYTEGSDKTWATLYVVDTGTRGAWATLLAFAPDKPEKIKAVEDVVKTAKKG